MQVTNYLISNTEAVNGNFMFTPVRFLREADCDLSLQGVANFTGKAAIITGLFLSIFAAGAGIYLIVKANEEWNRQEALIKKNNRVIAPSVQPIANPVKPITDSAKPVEKEIKNSEHVQNVVVFGVSGAGKSTLIEVLSNVCHVAQQTSLFALTKEPKLYDPILFEPYTLNLMDTPGLFEEAKIGEKKRSNETLIQSIQAQTETHFGGKKFEKINTAIFAVPYGEKIRLDDIESMETIIPTLDPKTRKIFVITKAECLEPADREGVRTDLLSHARMKKLLEEHFNGKDGILFSGSLDETSAKIPQNVLIRIYRDKECLIAKLLPGLEKTDSQEERKISSSNKINAFINVAKEEEEEEARKKAKTERQAAKALAKVNPVEVKSRTILDDRGSSEGE